MQVRRRTDDDLPACVAVLRRVHLRDGYPSRWPDDPAAWLTPVGVAGSWVAVADGAIVGHASLARVEDESGRVELVRLFTDPDARQHGLGRALVGAVLDAARQHGWRVWLEVVASTESAVAFYEHTGWRRAGSTVATWTAADGSHPLLLRFDAPE